MFRCNPLVLISDVLGNCVQAKAGAATFVCPSPLAFTVLTQLSCLANLPQGEIISMYDGQEKHSWRFWKESAEKDSTSSFE